MQLLRNFRHYRFSSVVMILGFMSIFFISANLPLWIGNQQDQFVEVGIQDLVFHFKFNRRSFIYPNLTEDIIINNHPAVETSLAFSEVTFEDILGSKNSTLDYIQLLPYDAFSSLSCYTLSNASYSLLQPLLQNNHSAPLTGDEIIINPVAAEKWKLAPGDTFYIAKNRTLIHSGTEQIGSADPVEMNFTVVDVVENMHLDPRFAEILYWDSYFYGTRVKFNEPLMIISNFQFIDALDNLEPGFQPITTIFVQLEDKVVQNNDLKNSFASIQSVSTYLHNQLDSFYLIQIALWELTEVYSRLVLLQFLFLLLIIPSFIISTVLIYKTTGFWIEMRFAELDVIFKRGMGEKEIQQLVKREIGQFLLFGYLLAGTGTFILSVVFEQKAPDSMMMYLLIGTCLLFVFWQVIKSRIFDMKNRGIPDRTWRIGKKNYWIITAGLLLVLIEIIHSESALGFGFLSVISSAVAPFFPLVTILAPLIGLYGSLLSLFVILRFVSVRAATRYRILSSLVLQDIARNSKEIMQVIALLSIGMTVALGPVIANDMIADYDRRQLEAFYGAHYSTGFMTGLGNYTQIKTELNAVDGLRWAVAVEQDGNIHVDSPQGPSFGSRILLVSDSYFQVLTPENREKLKSLQVKFEDSTNTAFLQKETLNSEFFDYLTYFDTLFVSIGYEDEPMTVQHAYGGSFTILPGAFIGHNGYVPPFTPAFDNYGGYQEHMLLGHLTDDYLPLVFGYGSRTFINFLFDTSEVENTTNAIDRVQSIIGMPLMDYYTSIESASYGGSQQTVIISGLFTITAVFNLFLVLLMLLVLFQAYIMERRTELGIMEIRGASRFQVYRLLALEFTVITLSGISWAGFHVLLYGTSIASYASNNHLFPLGMALSWNTVFSILLIFATVILLGLIRPLLHLRHETSYLLQRRT